MKKFLLGALFPLLMLSSCNSNDEEGKGVGNLVIKTKIITDGIQIVPTRVEKTTQLSLTMINKANNKAFIEGDLLTPNLDYVIEDIPIGSYGMSLTTHPNGFTPTFGVPCYEGSVSNFQITENSNQDLNIDCIQKNAGVRFIYDSSLQIPAYKDMYPVITQNGVALEYKGNQKEKIGYFNTGDVTLSFTDANGVYYAIGGKEEHTLTLKSEQLWEITLKTETEPEPNEKYGSIKMSVSIITINEPTDYNEFSLDKSENIFIYKQTDTSEGFRLNVKSMVQLDHFWIYYCEQSTWDGEEITEEKIMNSGNKISSDDIQEINTPNGKSFSFSLKPNTEYLMGIYGKKNEIATKKLTQFKSPDPTPI